MDTPSTVVFLHAHPDDEAIFTGGTMAMLAAEGHRVVLIVATSGGLGLPRTTASDLPTEREDETLRCCEALGVEAVHFLRFQDSGLHGENPSGFVHQRQQAVTQAAEAVLRLYGRVDCLVSYDDHGIYGHPDHLQVNLAGRALHQHLSIPTLYESTVDREYLHFVETHIVVEAGLGERPLGRGLAASDLGLPSLLIDLTIDVGSVLDRKRQAMAAHESQLPADAPAFALGQQNFAAVYGYEWYVRHGPQGPLDLLPQI